MNERHETSNAVEPAQRPSRQPTEFLSEARTISVTQSEFATLQHINEEQRRFIERLTARAKDYISYIGQLQRLRPTLRAIPNGHTDLSAYAAAEHIRQPLAEIERLRADLAPNDLPIEEFKDEVKKIEDSHVALIEQLKADRDWRDLRIAELREEIKKLAEDVRQPLDEIQRLRADRGPNDLPIEEFKDEVKKIEEGHVAFIQQLKADCDWRDLRIKELREEIRKLAEDIHQPFDEPQRMQADLTPNIDEFKEEVKKIGDRHITFVDQLKADHDRRDLHIEELKDEIKKLTEDVRQPLDEIQRMRADPAPNYLPIEEFKDEVQKIEDRYVALIEQMKADRDLRDLRIKEMKEEIKKLLENIHQPLEEIQRLRADLAPNDLPIEELKDEVRKIEDRHVAFIEKLKEDRDRRDLRIKELNEELVERVEINDRNVEFIRQLQEAREAKEEEFKKIEDGHIDFIERLKWERDYVLNVDSITSGFLRFARRCEQRAAEAAAEAYIAHGVQALLAADVIARKVGGRIYGDIVEMPSFGQRSEVFNADAVNLSLLDHAFASFLREVAGISTIGWALKEHLDKYGPRVSVIPNYRRAEQLQASDQLREQCGIGPGDRLLLASSTMYGGLEPIIEALLRLPDNVHLATLGTFRQGYRPEVEALVERLELGGRVHFFPPVPYEQLSTVSSGANIGLMAVDPTRMNTQVLLPNRLFDCIAAGLPIVSPDIPDIARILGSRNLGVTVPTQEAAAWAGAIETALANEQTMRANAMAAARELVWESLSDDILAAYDHPRSVTIVSYANLTSHQRTRRITETLMKHGVKVTICCPASDEPGPEIPGVKYVFTPTPVLPPRPEPTDA